MNLTHHNEIKISIFYFPHACHPLNAYTLDSTIIEKSFVQKKIVALGLNPEWIIEFFGRFQKIGLKSAQKWEPLLH